MWTAAYFSDGSRLELVVPAADVEEFDAVALGTLLEGQDDHLHFWGPSFYSADDERFEPTLGVAQRGLNIEALMISLIDDRPGVDLSGQVAVAHRSAELSLTSSALAKIRAALRSDATDLLVQLRVRPASKRVHHVRRQAASLDCFQVVFAGRS